MHEGTTTTAARAGPRIIERPRLTKILDESDARIILLVAPAGYGKTTLARQWLKDKPHVWYQATAASADPVALALGLEMALGAPPNGVGVAQLFGDTPALAPDAQLLAAVLRAAPSAARPPLVAIDDFHHVARSPKATELIRAFAGTAPVRLLLTSRTEADPRWIRDVIYGEAIRIDADDLAFDAEELDRIFEAVPTGVRNPEAAEALKWPLLGSLAAAARQAPGGSFEQPAIVYEFLAGEVLSEASPALQEMLEMIALAPSYVQQQSNAPRLIQEAMNLGLLQRVQPHPEIHPVLAELLKRRFARRSDARERARSLIEELVDAACWDEAFGIIDEFDRGDLLGCLLEAAVPDLLRHGRFETVSKWVAVAERLRFSGPVLDYVKADTLARAGRHLEAIRAARRAAERSLDRQIASKALVAAGRSAYYADRASDAVTLLQQAVTTATTDRDVCDALALLLVVVTDAEVPRPKLLEAIDSLVPRDPESRLRLATARLIEHCRLGPISTARRIAAENEAALHSVSTVWTRSAFLSMVGFTQLLSADYESSVATLSDALDDVRKLKFKFAIAQIQLHLAIAELGRQRFRSAARLLRLVEVEARQSDDAYLEASVATVRMRLLLAHGLSSDAVALQPPRETQTPAARGEWLAVRALAHAVDGEKTVAREFAEQAVQATRSVEARVFAVGADAISDASPERAKLLVSVARNTGNLDGLITVMRLSERLRSSVASLMQVESTLGLFARSALDASVLPQRPELRIAGPLSPREREVLDLLRQGLSNRQIAQVLFISEVTVKVHLRHVYGKLGVRTRTEAALVARDLESDIGIDTE